MRPRPPLPRAYWMQTAVGAFRANGGSTPSNEALALFLVDQHDRGVGAIRAGIAAAKHFKRQARMTAIMRRA